MSNIILTDSLSSSTAQMEAFLSEMKNYGLNILVTVNYSSDNGSMMIMNVKPTFTRTEIYLNSAEIAYTGMIRNLVDSIYVSPEKLMTPSAEVSRFINADGSGDSNDGFNKFMSEKENSLVKAFKDSGGKGLAGVIESMNFDWYDKVTWETTKVGKKAPKLCKVTLAFSPIHDISPGLDSNGYNRAPIYPVGPNDGESFKTPSIKSSLSRDGLMKALGQSPGTTTGIDNSKK